MGLKISRKFYFFSLDCLVPLTTVSRRGIPESCLSNKLNRLTLATFDDEGIKSKQVSTIIVFFKHYNSITIFLKIIFSIISQDTALVIWAHGLFQTSKYYNSK